MVGGWVRIRPLSVLVSVSASLLLTPTGALAVGEEEARDRPAHALGEDLGQQGDGQPRPGQAPTPEYYVPPRTYVPPGTYAPPPASAVLSEEQTAGDAEEGGTERESAPGSVGVVPSLPTLPAITRGAALTPPSLPSIPSPPSIQRRSSLPNAPVTIAEPASLLGGGSAGSPAWRLLLGLLIVLGVPLAATLFVRRHAQSFARLGPSG